MRGGSAWAPSLTAEQLRLFLMMVEGELQSRELPYRFGDGVVEVDTGGGAQGLGLGNLAQVCAGIAAADWPRTIARHFDLVFAREAEEAELESRIRDFGRVRELLRVRLYEEAIFDEQVTRPVGDGLVASLVFDLPTAMRSVARNEASAWGVPDDELFAAALANLAAEDVDEPRVLRGPEEVPVVVVEGASYYTSSRALLLEGDVVPEGHPYGAIVAVPGRHVFFFHVIEDPRVIHAINALVRLAHEAHRRGPGSISDQIYWVRRGVWQRIPCGVDDGTLHVSPPAAFVRDVLERVIAPAS